MFVYDMETTGLAKDAEITQLACVDLEGEKQFSEYILASKGIDPGASKVTGLSIEYSEGVRSLCKDGKLVEATDRLTALRDLSEFLRKSSKKPKLLIAQNGQPFDAPHLVANIAA